MVEGERSRERNIKSGVKIFLNSAPLFPKDYREIFSKTAFDPSLCFTFYFDPLKCSFLNPNLSAQKWDIKRRRLWHAFTIVMLKMDDQGGRHSSVVSSAPTILRPLVWIPITPYTLFSICIIEIVMRESTKINKKGPGLGQKWSISKKQYNFYSKFNVKKYLFNIKCWDSNPQP